MGLAMSNTLVSGQLITDKDIREAAYVILRYIRLLCLGSRPASIYLHRSFEGLEISPNLYEEIEIPKTKIFTWAAPHKYPDDEIGALDVRLSIQPSSSNKLGAKVYFVIRQSGLSATINIKLSKEDGVWIIESLLAE